jgi:AraC-like DNA-binding protein
MRQYYPDLDSVRFNVYDNPVALDKIKSSMGKLVHYTLNSQDEFVDLMRNVEILNIYHTLLKECMVSKKNPYVAKVPGNFSYAKKVLEYIAENYKNEITLDQISSLVGLSPAYFSKYFKNITGTNFVQYLNRVRLEHAIKDMLTRNLSVTDAALENGFPNVKSYITTCKAAYGLTPGQYRKQYPEY